MSPPYSSPMAPLRGSGRTVLGNSCHCSHSHAAGHPSGDGIRSRWLLCPPVVGKPLGHGGSSRVFGVRGDQQGRTRADPRALGGRGRQTLSTQAGVSTDHRAAALGVHIASSPRRIAQAGAVDSVYTPPRTEAVRTESSDGSSGDDGLAESFATLSRFLTDHDLTAHLAAAEAAFHHAGSATSRAVTIEYGFSDDLLDAALAVRAHVGRLNDVIHATVIARVLPAILEEGEVVVRRPSLGAGNDRSRPFDLETDRRIAEFKVAQWKGADTMRKRGVVSDLVHLALDESGRRAQLFVVGALPVRFL